MTEARMGGAVASFPDAERDGRVIGLRGLGSPAPTNTCRAELATAEPTTTLSQRLSGAVATIRARYGEDPVFEILLNEAACLLLRSGAVTPDPMTAARQLPPEWNELSHRERQVTRLLAEGKSDREIAVALGIGLNTARAYSTAVLAKLGVHSRRQVHRLLPP